MVAVATVGVFACVLAFARLATAPGMSLLYAGLEGAQAGEVIQALDQRGLQYEVRGDAIYVASTARDETRMALAALGLPANSSTGYELLDGLTGFGTTSQMFDAAYWRAKEGELARTIMASPHIRHARVHIAQAATQPFRRTQNASASVTVTPAAAPITVVQAQALRFLVASAIAGVLPENVAVIDSNGGMVVAEDAGPVGQGGDRAEIYRQNVERLLEARVGAGRAVVEVNVETITDRETIIERLIDPEARAAVSQETEERNATSSDTGEAPVGVASNLPDGDAAGGDGRSESREVTSRERISWEVSETSREVERGPGAIRRLTVAVLIDGVEVVNENGIAEWQPRPESEMEALRELVASTVGYDESRGDVITLRSLPFEPVGAALGTGGSAGWIQQLGIDVMGLIKMGALAAVVLFLSLFVLRPLLSARPGAVGREQLLADQSEISVGPVLSGEIDTPDVPVAAITQTGAPVDGAETSDGAPEDDPVERMRQLISERQDETLEVLRSWMEEPEEQR